MSGRVEGLTPRIRADCPKWRNDALKTFALQRADFWLCIDSYQTPFKNALETNADNHYQTAQNIIEVGKRLIQAKSLVNHGHWQNWLEKNFQLSQASATRFMNCAERFGNLATLQDFQIFPNDSFALSAGRRGDGEIYRRESR